MEYITLSKEASASFIEKKSEFIGYAAPVKTEEEAMAFVNKIRKKHGDATHNCYAYMLANGNARYSDDGEPQGTAGVPILSVIQKGGFTDAVIVVTRYFGGILLGAGGLVRAYSAGARDAVAAAKIVKYSQYTEFRVRCSYSDYQKLLPVIERLGIKTDDTQFTDEVTLMLAAKPEIYQQFALKITEISAGTLIAEETGSRFSE